MSAKIIDGKAISQQIKDELKEKTAALKEKGIEVTLAVILVGEDPASQRFRRGEGDGRGGERPQEAEGPEGAQAARPRE